MATTHRYRAIVSLLLLTFFLLTIRLDSPWTGHHDENGSWISSGVRNYALYGAAELGYMQVINRGPATPDTYDYYVHHPPLIVWTGQALTEVAGRHDDGRPHEAVIRLVSIYATMISVVALYVLARRLYGVRSALWITALYALTPMMLYFGRMPNHEPLALGFILPFAAVFVNWMRGATWARWGLMAVLAGFAMWTAWASAFLFAGLGLATLIVGGNRQRVQMVLLGVVTLAMTAAVPLFYEMQHPGAIDDLRNVFTFRSGGAASRDSAAFTLGDFLATQLSHVLPLMSLLVIVPGSVGLWIVTRRRKGLERALILGLVGGALLYLLVFRNAHYIHDYYKIYWMPGMVLAAAVAIAAGLKTRPRGYGRYIRPTLAALFIMSTLISVAFFPLLHYSGVGAITLDLAAVVQANADETDTVATNLPFENTSAEYYAFREIDWNTDVAQFFALAESDDRVVYVYCPEEAGDAIPDAIADLEFVPALEDCRLIMPE